MNYYEHHIGDYAQATVHLSLLEDGAYSRLIRKYYAEEKPLPVDVQAVQRLIVARTDEEKQAVADILKEFFTLEEDGWHNKRCDEEIARYREKQGKARASANARWNKNKKPNAPAMRSHSEGNAHQTPDTNHQTQVIPPLPPAAVGGSTVLPDPFEDFWKAYPKKVGKEAARKAWGKIKKPADTLQAIKQAISWQVESEQWLKESGQFIPNPTTYLNQQRWLDEQPTKAKSARATTPQHTNDFENIDYRKGISNDGSF